MTAPVLEARGASKSFPGVQALEDVSLEIRRGEIHSLVGENGAGKSTLISILTGAQRLDRGVLLIDGVETSLVSPAAARRAGIVAIYQELALVPWLRVVDNITLGNEPTRLGMISGRRSRAEARNVLGSLDVDIDVDARVSTLRMAERQLVEIARALSADARVLVMDEPTSALPAADAERLLQIVTRLRDDGVAVLFVSHRLEEVLGIADRITVLRGGRVVETLAAGQASEDRLIELMVGTTLERLFPERSGTAAGDVALRADRVSRSGYVDSVSFDLRAGEIIGFAGLVGSGRTELMRMIAGIDRLGGGTVSVDGTVRRFKRPRDAIEAGVVYVPEDRKDDGLVLCLTGYENVALPTLRRFVRGALLRWRTVRTDTGEVAASVGVRGRLDRPARTLSGGNQQKLILAKWLLTGARVLILDEPTRGVDIGAKREIYALVRQLCDRGLAVVLVSSELPELTHLADRIFVMSGGHVTDVLEAHEFDEQRILRAAFAAHTVRHADEAA